MCRWNTQLKARESDSGQTEEFRKADSPRILVVDDSVETLMLLTEILTDSGYKVITVLNGHTALKLVEVEVPDLILLDVKMPDMDGYEVCHKLKSAEHSSMIPVIFISGLYEAASKIKGFNAGGVDYITKPFQLEEVLARVETHVALSHLQRQMGEQNIQLQQEISERERAEQELRKHEAHLEELVAERTAKLKATNEELQREIAERKQAEEAQRETEERYRLIVEYANEIIYQADVNGHFTFVNPTTIRLTGYSKDELIGKHYRELIRKDYRDDAERFYGMQFVKKIPNTYYEFPGITKEGKDMWIGQNVQLLMNCDKVVGFQAVSRDMTERVKKEEQLRSMSFTDSLTHLYNRRGFLNLAEHLLKSAERLHTKLLLAYIDLDNIKSINDTFGHEQGDSVLIDTADILRNTFRKSDIICRIGGDEFAVLATKFDESYPQNIIDRLQYYIDAQNYKRKKKYKISMSMGFAFYDPQTPCSLDVLMAKADQSMYEQKKARKQDAAK
jgi:two-component system cell cycle response regulator